MSTGNKESRISDRDGVQSLESESLTTVPRVDKGLQIKGYEFQWVGTNSRSPVIHNIRLLLYFFS